MVLADNDARQQLATSRSVQLRSTVSDKGRPSNEIGSPVNRFAGKMPELRGTAFAVLCTVHEIMPGLLLAKTKKMYPLLCISPAFELWPATIE